MSDNIRGTHSDLVAFLFLSIWPSHLGLPLLLLVILLSKTTHRHPTFINMCITWIISGFASCILYVRLHLSTLTSYLCSSTGSMLEKQPVQNLQKCSASSKLPSCVVFLRWLQWPLYFLCSRYIRSPPSSPTSQPLFPKMFSVIRSSSKRENAPVDSPLRLLTVNTSFSVSHFLC